MALACPQCGSENVQKISLVRSSGITHVTTQHQSTGMGVGVSTGGLGVGVGTSKGTSQGIQQSAISKQLNEEFASPPKLLLSSRYVDEGDPFVYFFIGLGLLGLFYLLYSFLDITDSNYPWLVDLTIIIGRFGLFVAGLSCVVYGILGFDPGYQRTTPERKQEMANLTEKLNKEAIEGYAKKVSEFNELRDKGFYCHACGNKFLRK